MTTPKHQPIVSVHRGQAIYTCRCGWVGKQKESVTAARRLYERHLERVEAKA